MSRARKMVVDYLAPRCEDVDPMNPCHCPARVGVALHKGFIRRPGEVQLRKPVAPFGRYGAGPNNEDAPMRDVASIYQNLPQPDAPDAFTEALGKKIDSGLWDQVLEKKLRKS